METPAQGAPATASAVFAGVDSQEIYIGVSVPKHLVSEEETLEGGAGA